MKTYEILFIRKDDWQTPYESIGRLIGRRHHKRCFWWLSQQKAIELVENDIFSFYITIKKSKVPVIVGINAAGQKYLKAEGDEDIPYILLSVPQRPKDNGYMRGEEYPCAKYHELHRRRWAKRRKLLPDA